MTWEETFQTHGVDIEQDNFWQNFDWQDHQFSIKSSRAPPIAQNDKNKLKKKHKLVEPEPQNMILESLKWSWLDKFAG